MFVSVYIRFSIYNEILNFQTSNLRIRESDARKYYL